MNPYNMSSSHNSMEILVEKLKCIGVLKYGTFELKSGQKSNYYCDFRTLISYPVLLKTIYEFIPNSVFENVDLVCGVYFGGVPLANLISFERNIPQLFIRDTEKKHGTKKQVEGDFKEGQTVLLVEDVITTGKSILEKIRILEYYGLNIKLLTILNRSESLHELYGFYPKQAVYPIHFILPLDKIVKNGIGGMPKIYDLAFKKQSNIILSVDLFDANEIIQLIEETKHHIIGIKLHSDIVDNFAKVLAYLKTIRDDFILIEDCKVADISYISIRKVKNYVDYADYITYHCLLGTDLPQSLKTAYPDLGLLGVVEMSAKGCLINGEYMDSTKPQFEWMDGCVIQKNGMERLRGSRLPITFSPGISLNATADDHNQTYRNPLNDKVGEFWIIGRSIYLATDREEECAKYKRIGWDHFIQFQI